VRFDFHVDGFPDEPAEKDLPHDLVAVDLRVLDASLTGHFNDSFGEYDWHPSSGSMQMTDSYLTPGRGIEEKRVTFKLDPGQRGEFGQGPGFRNVHFYAEVTKSEDTYYCPQGAAFEMLVKVRKNFAVVQAFSSGASQSCLSVHEVVWTSHRIKRARISAPQAIR
jgi:hypothetical protein